MPPTLPISLSPHVCILPSQDLVELLEEASLPALHQVLQAFSPLSRSPSPFLADNYNCVAYHFLKSRNKDYVTRTGYTPVVLATFLGFINGRTCLQRRRGATCCTDTRLDWVKNSAEVCAMGRGYGEDRGKRIPSNSLVG